MPAARDETEVVEHEVFVEAPPDVVFGYFTDPSRLTRWMGTEATLDPRPGGVCRVAFEDVAAMRGSYQEVVPYTRVAFTWGWETRASRLAPGETLVEVSLDPEGDGTRVRLTHTRLPAAAVEFHRDGWTHYLGRLTTAAAGGDPGPDPMPGRGAAAS